MSIRKSILVTGGAGFIGSNLVAALLSDERIGKVRVLDNLSTGFEKNIQEFNNNKDFEFINGDIRDYNTCKKACVGIHLISHQAALGSVPRSIKDPLTTNDVNIGGTLNIFNAAIANDVEKVVFAASSSTYGDSKDLPKVEDVIGRPLSPYAVTKYVSELYADVFSKTYNFNYIGLRYFNVFGPKQDPNGAYAAVIPLFFKAAIDNISPVINGDGSYSRDFTYIDNVVEINLKALFTNNKDSNKQIYNVACGHRTDLNQLWTNIKSVSGATVDATYGPARVGDVPHSLANIDKAKALLDYNPLTNVQIGLSKAYQWYKLNN